jgi:hypothetical protein
MIRYLSDRTKRATFFLFLVSFAFTACKKADEGVLGGDILPGSDNLTFLATDTFSLLTYTVEDDSVRTDERSVNPLGFMNDPYFGRTSTAIYTQIRLPENNLNFATVKLDSIVLTLKYQSKTAYYGNINSTQRIHVYELRESLYLDSVYHSQKRPAYYPELVGAWQGKFNLNDSITIVQGSKTRKLAPHLRIRLTGQQFIDKIRNGGSNFATNDAFINYMKGLVVIPQEYGTAPGEGAIVNMDLLSTISNLTIYYNDSLSKDLLINENSPRFNAHDHNYMGTALGWQFGLKQHRDTCYAQSMGGVKTFFKVPHILNVVKNANGRPVAVAGAELTIPVLPGAATAQYGLPLEVFFVTADSAGKNFTLPGGILVGYAGRYNSTKTAITVNLSAYYQSIFNAYRETGVARDYGLYIVPSYNYAGMERIVLNTAKFAAAPAKLKLTYSVIQ